MSNYARGANAERDLLKFLMEDYATFAWVIRSAGSHGWADLWASRWDGTDWAIQVKRNKNGVRKAREDLGKYKVPAHVKKMTAYRENKRWIFEEVGP